MGSSVTLAADSSLVNGYNKTFGDFFKTTGGMVIANVLAGIAAVLLVVLIVALIMKGMGRQNELVNRMTNSGKTIFFIVLAIFVLAGPKVTLPLLVKAADFIISGVGDGATGLLDTSSK